MNIKKLLKNLKKRITVLAVAMIAIQPVLVGGMMMPAKTFAATNHVVISEIQTAQSGAGNYDNEFVELYNPTASPVDMSAIKLHIRNSSGTDENKVLTFTSTTIPANGFFLIAANADTGYATTIGADATYTITGNKLVADGGVYISNSVTAGAGVIDMVGWDSQPAGGYEGTPTNSPLADNSIERKANMNSTTATMIAADATKGNAWDTDVNSANFVDRTISQPQNSLSSIEDIIAPVVTVNTLVTNNQSPTVTGTIDDNSTIDIDVTVNGTLYVGTNNLDGTWSATVSAVLVENIYDVHISATDLNGNIGTDYTTGELTIDKTAPGEVTDLTAVGGNSKATLKWTNPVPVATDFTGVAIYRDGTLLDPSGTPVSGTSYEDTGVVNGTSYKYTVRTVDGAGNKSVGKSVTVTPHAPVVLSPATSNPPAGPVAPKVKLAVATTDYTPVYYGDGSTLAQGDVKADTTNDDKSDDGSKSEQNDVKEKQSIPLWGIIFLLVLAGIGGYLFYSQSPKQDGKK